MAKKLYMITQGKYDDYGVLVHLEGDEFPPIGALRQSFDVEYGVIREPDDGEDWNERFEAFLANEHAIRDKTGMNTENLFIHWLKEKHGFVQVDVIEENI